MKSRFQQKSASSYSLNVQAPKKNRTVSSRGIVGLALSLLLPPAGLIFLWRKGVFRTRGRMLITAISTIEIMIICVLLTPHAELTVQLPAPATPARVTAAPTSEALDALYNIEQLLYEQQVSDIIAQGGSEEDLMSDAEIGAQKEAEKQAIMNTIVYSVYNGAKYYHAKKICGTQTNGRELTVEQACSEGLGACKNCNPPVWTGD